jgi:uroporphyrinogen-III synthase
VRLLVTRPAPDGERTAAALRGRGHHMLVAPMLRMQTLDCAIADRPYAAVVMTSANAARAIAGHPCCRALRSLAAFTVGCHTAAAARAAGFRDVHCADGDRNDLTDLLRRRLAESAAPLLYLAGEDRAGGEELTALAATTIAAVIYRMIKAERFPTAVGMALAQRRIDGVLHFSRRSCEAYLDCASRGGLIPRALEPLQFCLSRQVAEPLVAQGFATEGLTPRGLAPQGLAPQDFAPQDFADPDLAAGAAAGIRIAPHPDEASLIGLIDSC